MNQKKVLLVILPIFWPKMPPLGIAYLKEFLKKKSITADMIDINNYFYNLSDEELKKSWQISCNTFLEDNIISIIKKKYPYEFDKIVNRILQYDIIGFSCFKSNIKNTVEIIKILKSKKSSIEIILGGPEITRMYFKTKGDFTPDIKAISNLLVVGEGEKSIYGYLNEENNNRAIIEFQQMENLDDLPYPEFQDLDFNSYPRKESIPLMFGRGCVRQCNFCSEKLLHKGFRCRSINSIIDEIKFHISKNSIKYFIFYDSMLNADLKKFEKLCDEIIKNFGSINWEAQIAVRNDMDIALFKKMKMSGCYNLFIGLESGSAETLRRMNKGFTPQDAKSFFEKLILAKFFFGISIIVGYPGETDEDFRESLNFVIANKDIIPKIEQINPFTYYDGTNTNEFDDYKLNPVSTKRMEVFIDEIKKYKFKYTNAFLGNLVEK